MNNGENEAQTITKEKDEACLYAFLLSTSFTVPTVLHTAIELGLFDIIAKKGIDAAGISASEIASNLPTKNGDAPKMLETLLGLLAAHSILTCSLHTLEDGEVVRLYGLAPTGKFFVTNGQFGPSLASFFLVNNNRDYMDVWSHLKDAILDGGNPYFRARGIKFFQHVDSLKLSKSFHMAMSDSTNIIDNKILKTYKGFEGLASLVDVGGGIGTTLNRIISKYPSIKGINFDLPHVIKLAPPYHGIKHVGGDMFVSIPKGETICLKRICHNWDDERCLQLLRNCYEALPQNGKVILIDYLMPLVPDTSNETKYVSQLDNVMLVYFGGKERTIKEFEALSKGAGFSGIQVICCAYTDWIVEIYK